MSRLAWSQLRFRAARSLALLAGMLVAATAFTVLTAAARTSQLRTVGTVTAHFRAAYDILVRPAGARTRWSRRTGTVQPNFLSGIYGGITMAQYHQIQQIPGVQVAAPIAMVGYSLPDRAGHRSGCRPPAVAGPAGSCTGSPRPGSARAAPVRIPQPPSYVYVTSNPIRQPPDGRRPTSNCRAGPRPACALATRSAGYAAVQRRRRRPALVLVAGQRHVRRGLLGGPDRAASGLRRGLEFPMLIAAVDPAAEAKLDGLNRAVTSGHYLGENDGPWRSSSRYRAGGPRSRCWPPRQRRSASTR